VIDNVTMPGAWDVVRYTKALDNPIVLYHGSAPFHGESLPPLSLAIGKNGAVYFFDRDYSSLVTNVVAVGPVSWSRPFEGFPPGAWQFNGVPVPGSQPTLGLDDTLYFQTGAALTWGRLWKVDPITGDTLASVDSSSTFYGELSLDGNNHLRGGGQISTGVQFVGWYASFDTDFNRVSITEPYGYTNSRPSVMPDGSSTVRVGYSFGDDRFLISEGAFSWNVELTPPQRFASLPTIDSTGRIFIGRTGGLSEIDPTTGGELWTVRLTDDITTQPVVDRDGGIVVGGTSGSVYALRAAVPGPPPTPPVVEQGVVYIQPLALGPEQYQLLLVELAGGATVGVCDVSVMRGASSVAVGNDRAIYVNDTRSTKVWSIR
jgi:hypothetical protein